jgi:hypothetical protein
LIRPVRLQATAANQWTSRDEKHLPGRGSSTQISWWCSFTQKVDGGDESATAAVELDSRLPAAWAAVLCSGSKAAQDEQGG